MIYFQFQVDRLLESKENQIKFLQAFIEDQKKSLDYEKKRADLAVDRLLSEREIRSIHPSPERKPDPDSERMEKIKDQLPIVESIGGDFSSENGSHAI